MSTFTSGSDVAEFLEGFRQYVREPLTEARQAIKQDQEELSKEIDAFETFIQRLETINPPGSQTEQTPTSPLVQADSETTPIEAIRTAYQETVLAVDHYDQVYDISLEKHFVEEFGPDIGCHILAQGSSTIPPQYVDVLEVRSRQAIDARQNFLDLLEEEHASIERADTVITDLAGQCSEIRIPEWYQEEFLDELSQLTEKRQEQIRTYEFDLDCDGHDLCSYLYGEEKTTYPVLTAIGRLRSVVTL